MTAQTGKQQAKSDQSPIVLALKAIADALGRTNLNVRSYKDKADFEELWAWAADPKTLLPTSDPQNAVELVIVADGIPQRKANLDESTRFVAAEPWSLALAQAFVKANRNLRLTLLATDPKINTNMPKSCGDGFVCVHWFSETTDDLKALIDHLNNTPSAPIGKQDVGTVQAKLREEWRKAISDPSGMSNSHHDVSNQVGAAILSACLGEDHSAVMARCDISDLHDRATWISVRSQYAAESLDLTGVAEDLKDMKITIVDDHHAEGFEAVVRQLLGCSLKARKGVFDETSADHDAILLDKSLTLLGVDWKEWGAKPYAFRGIDILLLDLRLWTSKQEKSVLSKYMQIAKAFIEFPTIHPSIKERLEAIASDSAQLRVHRQLALMPLMLTAIDPSLPIILFSSTRHRSVIHAVRSFPNIITNFAKPYIGSIDTEDDDPVQLVEDLRDAIAVAQELWIARAVWCYAVQTLDIDVDVTMHFKWHPDWEPIEIDGKTHPHMHPLVWLRDEWIPLAQRKEFALACAAFWHYLVRVFGAVALEIVCQSGREDDKTILRRLRKASGAPLVAPTTVGCSNRDFEEILVAIGWDFVNLLKGWRDNAKKPQAADSSAAREPQGVGKQ